MNEQQNNITETNVTEGGDRSDQMEAHKCFTNCRLTLNNTLQFVKCLNVNECEANG
jgi:hypothetical protein